MLFNDSKSYADSPKCDEATPLVATPRCDEATPMVATPMVATPLVATPRYAEAGVDIAAGNRFVKSIANITRQTQTQGQINEIGGFGGLFDLKAKGYNDPLLVSATDGVGTKLKLAILANNHETIGIDLVAMCVNDLIVQGAEPLFFLDYFACSKLDERQAKTIIAGIAEGCKQAGCALLGGETAEMPDMYHDNDYDLAGFAVGAVEREELLPCKNLRKGDVILGIASSGIHSNGYSLVRKIIDDGKIDVFAAAPFDENTKLIDYLLLPTKIYVKNLLELQQQTKAIKAMAHITGGGISENIPRVLPENLTAEINLDKLPVGELFSWIKKISDIADEEMLQVFNCGIGMAIIVDVENAEQIKKLLTNMGENVAELGVLVNRQGKQAISYKEKIQWL